MRAILRELRLHQWAKNILIFVPLVAAHRMSDRQAVAAALLAFLSFGFCASGGYVLNDLMDLAADRRHPVKRSRPLASGEMGTETAWTLALFSVVLSFALAWFLPRDFRWLLLGYLSATVLYTAVFKKIALVDVMLLASLYAIRIFAGSRATGIPISEWLLAFAMFFFLSLALAKRFAELRLLAVSEIPAASGRGYSKADLDYIPIMGISSGFLTSLVMALYVSGDHVRGLYRRPEFLWLICPLILYWIGRVWLLCHRGKMSDDPVVFALKDPVSFIVALAGLLVLVAAA